MVGFGNVGLCQSSLKRLFLLLLIQHQMIFGRSIDRSVDGYFRCSSDWGGRKRKRKNTEYVMKNGWRFMLLFLLLLSLSLYRV